MNVSDSYIAIDLKSFYASVECVDRGLNPLDTNLLVADTSRTDRTICLAVSPPLKEVGVPGRPRLFEAVKRINEVNSRRRAAVGRFTGISWSRSTLAEHPDYELGYIIATPRMARYIEYSSRIYDIYLRYIAPEDIHVYSIDEVFIYATPYLKSYRMTPHQLAMTIIRDVLRTTGITATAGIGPNMYLCKVAMDIIAKKQPADSDGVRIAQLDEMSYRRLLWQHTPLTDFWRIGHGISNRLAEYGIYTMGDIARTSLTHEDLLYSIFGVNAELLIDHAWGYECTTIAQVKAYRPATTSLSCGQVLASAYDCSQAIVAIQEMAESLALDLVAKRLATDRLVMDIGYDSSPLYAHGTERLDRYTFAASTLIDSAAGLFIRLADPLMYIRRLNLSAIRLVHHRDMPLASPMPDQLDLFTDYDALRRDDISYRTALSRERSLMQAVIGIKQRYGKNSLLRGLNYRDGATARERNTQIGGHKA